MAVTCSFERKYGRLKVFGHDGKTYPCDIWSKGNCLMVITYGKQKSFQCFFADISHLKRCAKAGDLKGWFAEADLSSDLPYAKDVAILLAQAGVPCRLWPSEKKFR